MNSYAFREGVAAPTAPGQALAPAGAPRNQPQVWLHLLRSSFIPIFHPGQQYICLHIKVYTHHIISCLNGQSLDCAVCFASINARFSWKFHRPRLVWLQAKVRCIWRMGNKVWCVKNVGLCSVEWRSYHWRPHATSINSGFFGTVYNY